MGDLDLTAVDDIERGWSGEDDSVLAEFGVVVLGDFRGGASGDFPVGVLQFMVVGVLGVTVKGALGDIVVDDCGEESFEGGDFGESGPGEFEC